MPPVGVKSSPSEWVLQFQNGDCQVIWQRLLWLRCAAIPAAGWGAGRGGGAVGEPGGCGDRRGTWSGSLWMRCSGRQSGARGFSAAPATPQRAPRVRCDCAWQLPALHLVPGAWTMGRPSLHSGLLPLVFPGLRS